MTPARARRLVIASGLVGAAAIALGIGAAGGPSEGRREQRDALRLGHVREIAQAIVCHAEAGAAPPAPARLADISPACLSPARAGDLRDPVTDQDYGVAWPEPGLVQVCAGFEATGRGIEPYPGWPPFDPATGCVSGSLPGQD